MRQQHVIQVDPVSRQTVAVRRRYADSSASEGEGGDRSMCTPTPQDSHIPEISSRAKSYRGRGIESTPVHDRLYTKAVQQQINSHNKQVDVMHNKLNLSLKPWESNARSATATTSWTQVTISVPPLLM